MKDSTSIEIKQPVKWWNNKYSINWPKLVEALSKAFVMLKFGKASDALKEALGIIGAISSKDDLNKRGYYLFLKTFINSSYQLLKENRSILINLKISSPDLHLYHDDNIVKFLDEISNRILNSPFQISKDLIENPRKLEILDKFQIFLNDWLENFGLSNLDAKNISNRFPSYFVLQLNEEWSENNEYYGELFRKLNTPIINSAKKEIEWNHYFQYLQKVISENVFDESFGLSSIYIPLRGYYKEKVLKSLDSFNIYESEEQLTRDTKFLKRVFWLEHECLQWIESNNLDDAIKVLCGGPGSGKSSFAKILAAKIAEEKLIRILFIPLHNLNLSDNLSDAIGDYISKNTNIKLSYNPLDEIDNEDRILIIFDGLDELSKQGKFGLEVSQTFIRDIERLCRVINTNQHIKLKVLITGREVVIQNNEREFNSEKQVIHLLSYFVPDDELKDFIGNTDILYDQRDNWWKNYSKLNGLNFQMLPRKLKSNKLIEITSQPLLNYLIAINIKLNDGQILFSARSNLNDIYRELIKGVYNRSYEKREYSPIKGLTLIEFQRVLQEIAISAWKEGDIRVISLKNIQKQLTETGLINLINLFKEDVKNGISKLITAFYFRQEGLEDGEPTFEFTHKSFGEYLTANRLIQLVFSIHKSIQQKKETIDFGYDEFVGIEKWYNLTGESPIDEYLLTFLNNEIKNFAISDVNLLQQSIISLINIILKEDVILKGNRKSFKEELRLTRNAIESLIVLHCVCAERTKTVSKLEFPDKFTFTQLLSRICHNKFEKEIAIGIKCLSYLEIRDQDIRYIDIRNVSFENSFFKNCTFNYCNFEKSNLKRAEFFHTIFERCFMEKSVFYKCNLNDCSFIHSDISVSTFAEANMNNVMFKKCELLVINFRAIKTNSLLIRNTRFLETNFRDSELNESTFEDVFFNADHFDKSKIIKGKFIDCSGLSAKRLSKCLLFDDIEGLEIHFVNEIKELMEKTVPNN